MRARLQFSARASPCDGQMATAESPLDLFPHFLLPWSGQHPHLQTLETEFFMLTSLVRRARHWLSLSFPTPNQVTSCLPEWSDWMAQRHVSIWRKVKPYTM